MSGVKLGGREFDLTIPECGLAIMNMIDPARSQLPNHANMCDRLAGIIQGRGAGGVVGRAVGMRARDGAWSSGWFAVCGSPQAA